MQANKFLYLFQEGNAEMRELLGGKGANLCEMARLGLPVPPGFVITTEACLEYYTQGNQLPEGLWEDVQEHLKGLERTMGQQFGSSQNPLLVSVRSGAKVSMPGMMDTILNLGINDEVAEGLGRQMGDRRPALDAYRRFIQAFSDVVIDVDSSTFESILEGHKREAGVELDYQLGAENLLKVIADYKTAVIEASGGPVPEDPWEQLRQSLEAVFKSWNNPRAISYRDHYRIPHDLGTAVTVMVMVFGNVSDDSGTGVLFTRNPATGEKEVYGEYLPNAQGEDVVAGIRTPMPITSLAESLPQVHQQLMALTQQLERHYQDVQDVEFTVERGRLFLLQTRNAKRTAPAAVKTAVDMVKEGLITTNQALKRVDAEELSQLFVPRFEVKALETATTSGAHLARGFGASPGAATGKVLFDATRAVEWANHGNSVILVRPETNPDDIHGIIASDGIVTSRGGITSHAAVVTRGMGKSCIVGCEELVVDVSGRTFTANGRTIAEGEEISVDGTTGEIFAGTIPTVQPDLAELEDAQTLLSWADEARRLGVWANADTPSDAQMAVSMGAEGIGLCRTEHMFLGLERVPVVQNVLVNAPQAERWAQEHPDATHNPSALEEAPPGVRVFYQALDQLKALQIEDFVGILRAMGERPVIIRLLDAPLHEFLPRYEELFSKVAELEARGASQEELNPHQESLRLVESLREANPMLGHRGCRLGLSFPSIYEMQVEAIMTAAVILVREGFSVHPEIMIPLTSHVNELRRLRQRLVPLADEVQRQMDSSIDYKFGTMIEVPRACTTAGEIAREADFFSFGTNDLTQTAYGYSRDDAEAKFLRYYLQEGILPENPFETLDAEGVGALIRMAVEQGRRTQPDLEVGICGEHGGDPASIAFCHRVGLDYVSCSPFRVPVARLAAAQAALDSEA